MPSDDIVGIGGDASNPADLGTDPGPAAPDAEGTSAADESTGDDLEQIAAEFDANAFEVASSKAAAATKEEGKAGSADPVERFIEKNYQGDRDAFVHSLYSSREELGRIRAELDALKAGAAQVPVPDIDAKMKETRAFAPELQALDQEVSSIDGEITSVTQDTVNITNRAQLVNNAIKEKSAAMAKAEIDDKPMIRAEIAELASELYNLESQYKANQRELSRLGSSRRQAMREILRAEQDLRSSLEDEARSAAEGQRVEAVTREQFGSSVEAHLSSLGIEAQSEQGRFLREVCRTKLRDYLLQQGDGQGLDGAQIHAAVGQILGAANKVFNLRPQRRSASNATQRPILTPRPPAIRPSPTQSSSGTPFEGALEKLSPKERAELVRKRASMIFTEAAKREQAKARGLS